jgi:hypothetical protein
LRHAHGNYTEQTIYRAGKIVGALGKALDKTFHEKVAETEVQDSYRKKHDYHEDVIEFTRVFKEDQLFHTISGRKHESFPVVIDVNFKQPQKLKKRLLDYSKKIDKIKDTAYYMKL